MTTTRSEVARVHTFDLGRWWLVGDRLLPKISGGSETAPDNTGGAGDEGEPGAGGAGQEGGESQDTDKPDTGSGGDDNGDRQVKDRAADMVPKPGEDRGAFKARRRAAEAEERAQRAEQELEDLRDRDRTETEKLVRRATKAEQRVAVLEPTVRQLAIDKAFLIASAGDARRKPINWVDSGDALVLVTKELEGIKVGDDGEIDQDEVRAVVEEVAKKKSHLVRKAQPAQEQPSGGNVGAQTGRQQQQGISDLRRAYPALGSRPERSG